MSSGLEDRVAEVVIVGSGPAAYTAATYAARAALRPIVVSGGLSAGGALMTTTEVENFPGFSAGVDGPVLVDSMRAQAERFGARLALDEIQAFELNGPVKRLVGSTGAELRARSVILAMGSQYRGLGLADEARLSGRGVSWCATCDGYAFSGKHVVVVGGGDSAAHEAGLLAGAGAQVTLVHRGAQLRASSIMRDRLLTDPRIDMVWESEVVALHGERTLSGLTLKHTPSGDERSLHTDGLFIAIGHDPRSDLVADQVDTDPEGHVLVEHPSTRTNLTGVFACGDLVDSRYRQAVTAAASGCAAALDAQAWLSVT